MNSRQPDLDGGEADGRGMSTGDYSAVSNCTAFARGTLTTQSRGGADHEDADDRRVGGRACQARTL